ncbi:hypothetical protein AAVH_33806, partial [Aphelenchoides avenae]
WHRIAMTQRLVVCMLFLALCLIVAEAQWGYGGYGGYGGGGFDPLVGGPRRQWRRYYRCLETGFCAYDYNTGHYFGRRELARNAMGGGW